MKNMHKLRVIDGNTAKRRAVLLHIFSHMEKELGDDDKGKVAVLMLALCSVAYVGGLNVTHLPQLLADALIKFDPEDVPPEAGTRKRK